VTRCNECDEWWCLTCEQECPVCLIGAGVETGIVDCSSCKGRACSECVLFFACVECDKPLCEGCWAAGISLCPGCIGLPEEEETPNAVALPPGWQIWDGQHRDFSKADPKAWRQGWKPRKKGKNVEKTDASQDQDDRP
jgi:hypothetical protein